MVVLVIITNRETSTTRTTIARRSSKDNMVGRRYVFRTDNDVDPHTTTLGHVEIKLDFRILVVCTWST
jgi:hypothetical protein